MPRKTSAEKPAALAAAEGRVAPERKICVPAANASGNKGAKAASAISGAKGRTARAEQACEGSVSGFHVGKGVGKGAGKGVCGKSADGGADRCSKNSGRKDAAANERPRTSRPRSHRRLAQAIFKERDMVAVGEELLQSKSATVKARVWETLVRYAFGEFAPATENPPVRQIIWDMPRPREESE